MFFFSLAHCHSLTVGYNILSTILCRKQSGSMAKKYRIKLNETECTELQDIVKKGKAAAHKRLHAQVLLKADECGEANWQDEQISEAFDIRTRTVERIRKKAVEQELQTALERDKQTKNTERKLEGEQEARLVALCCSEAPQMDVAPVGNTDDRIGVC